MGRGRRAGRGGAAGCADGRADGRADDGAAAVEFALVCLPLFALLFGIIQYGFVFYQLQGAGVVVQQAAGWAAEGIDDCTAWEDRTLARAGANGVGANLSPQVSADFTTPPVGRSYVTVTLEFTPLRLVPLVPMPSTIVRSAQADVENLPFDGIRDTSSGPECS